MLNLLKRLALGLFLIALASGILLATDRQRQTGAGRKVYAVGLLQHASIPVLDEGTQGALAALAAAGFREGDNLQLTRYNPQGDIGTANTTAREIVNGPFDLVLTISTVSLQTVHNANKDRKMKHVFGLVADPFTALPELDRQQPLKHPPYLVGQGIFPPVEDSFRLAKQMFPGLQKVGVVWNPAESNSETFTRTARVACQKLQLELLEATIDSSAGVLVATQALLGRGSQAIWVGGDVMVMVAIDSVIATARKGGIPVFTVIPGKADRGTLFDIGVQYLECGELAGKLAAEVLNGADPATIPIRDVLELVPRRLVVNRQVLAGLKDRWQVPDDIARRADVLVDDKGVVHQQKR